MDLEGQVDINCQHLEKRLKKQEKLMHQQEKNIKGFNLLELISSMGDNLRWCNKIMR